MGFECHSSYKLLLFSNLCDRVCSIFNDAGKFCLNHGLIQLTYDVKNDVRILNFRNDVISVSPRITPKDIRRRSLCDVNYHK